MGLDGDPPVAPPVSQKPSFLRDLEMSGFTRPDFEDYAAFTSADIRRYFPGGVPAHSRKARLKEISDS